MLSCPMCSKTFRKRGQLNVHLTTHTKEKPYKCSTCPASFSQMAHFKSHIRCVHKQRTGVQEKSFKCPMCTYESSESANLARHLSVHSSERPFSCNVPGCGFETKHKTYLSLHVRRAHNHERNYECTVEGCSYRSFDKSNFNVHLRVHRDENPMVCQFAGCNYACKQKSNLDRHVHSIHQNGKPFQCSVCEFQTNQRRSLRQHEDLHHKIKRFHCEAPTCSFATNDKQLLKRHLGMQHTKRDFKCTAAPQCKFRCGTAALLKIHVRKHMLPIWKCPAGDSCNFSARCPAHLRAHIARLHKDSESVPLSVPRMPDLKTTGQACTEKTIWVCPRPKCDYQTEFQHRYDRHIKFHDEGAGTFTCTFCSSKFPSTAQLEHHVLAHLGEKTYRCPYCEFTTAYSGELRRHGGKSHQIIVIPCGKENTYLKTCYTCKMACSSYSEFVLHSMSHLRAVVVLKRLSLQVM